MKKEFEDKTISSAKTANKILFIILILMILTACFSCAGPSLAEIEQYQQDSLKAARPVTPTNKKWLNNTYNASDFGLVPGVVVRWVPDELPNNITPETFPVVTIHIKQSDGVTKALPCTYDMWQQLLTGDTLR